MRISRVKITMLYCPKCQQTYEDGVQRFCTNDDARLLPAPSSVNSVGQSGGVFSNVINRKNGEENDEFATAPRFSQVAFRPPSSKTFKPEPELEIAPVELFDLKAEPTDDSEPELDLAPPVSSKDNAESFEDDLELEIEPAAFAAPPIDFDPILELEPETATKPAGEEEEQPAVESEARTETTNEVAPELPPIKAAPRVINSNEIASGSAALGDRKINPAGRTAVSWENPQALIGQTIKGRYKIVEQFGTDENAIDYLAEDKINSEKQIVVRVLMDEETDDSLFGKIFAEERITLSHISHPSVVSVIDSGELLEGKPFVITEYIKGESVKNHLDRKGKFDPLRAVRIVRQAAYALSEVHQSGILHRNLNPENIILTVNDIGAEQVKLINFGTPNVKLNEKNLPYKSPEQVEGKLANFASDQFSLAVVAYQMLTGRLPFNAVKIGSLLKEQREGLIVKTAVLNDKVLPPVDEILAKALSFNPADRYPKARDFGDALFNAVNSELPPTESAELAEEIPIPTPDAPLIQKNKKSIVLTPVVQETPPAEDVSETTAKIKAAEDSAWEKRSAEVPVQNTGSRTTFALLGLAILAAGLFAGWFYFLRHQKEVKIVAPTPVQSVLPVNDAVKNPTSPTSVNSSPLAGDIESFPVPRTVTQPANTNYFQNNKDRLSSEAAKNFLGFSLFYPQSWKLNETKNNFLDVSRTDDNNLPVEQMLVSYYDSKGTFNADRELFPKLLEKSNSDLKKALGDYQIISQGETVIQNGRWQAFEARFESAGAAPNGEKITLWGRRLWVPAQLTGLKNGYVITMLATSLSNDVKSVQDVGVKGELSNILETFEPLNQ